MKIAICDDEIKDIETIKRYVKSHSVKHEIIKFTSAVPLLKQIERGEKFDLLFLDIQMPDSNGWKIAKELKQSRVKTYIAMVTMLGDYWEYCFDRVDWFTAKPVSEKKIHSILNGASEKLYPQIMEFQTNKMKISLSVPEIWYFEVRHNDVLIFTIDKECKCRMSINEILKMLEGFNCFTQTHRSYVINLEYYKEIIDNDIILENGYKVPVSRNMKKDFLLALADFVGRCINV